MPLNNNECETYCKCRNTFLATLLCELGIAATKKPTLDRPGLHYHGYDFGCAQLLMATQFPATTPPRATITCDVRDWQTNGVIARFTMCAMVFELEAFAHWAAQAILMYHTRKGDWTDIKKIPSTTDNNPMTFADATLTAYTSAACAEAAREALTRCK